MSVTAQTPDPKPPHKVSWEAVSAHLAELLQDEKIPYKVLFKSLWVYTGRKTQYLLAALVGSLVATSFGMGYGANSLIHVLFPAATGHEPAPVMPTHVYFPTTLAAADAQSTFPWIVPAVSFLENEGHGRVSQKGSVWAASATYIAVSEPMTKPTPAFSVQFDPPDDSHVLSGQVFRRTDAGHVFVGEPVGVVKEGEGSFCVRIPPCMPGDKLVASVLIVSKSQLPKSSDGLNKLAVPSVYP